MLGAVIFFNDSFVNIVTITFTALVIIELLNVYTEVHRVNSKMVTSSVLTFLVYILSIALLREYFDTSYITWEFMMKVVALTAVSWLPMHIIKVVVYKFDPPEHLKIMKQE